jgi:hypothetical protein
MKKIITLLSLIALQSCSIIKNNSQERKIQSKIVNTLNSQSPKLSACAKKANVFKVFNQNRIRVVLYLTIDAKGSLRKFKLDDKIYPDEFANCVFQVVDLSIFPKSEKSQHIEIEQPFIFSEK